MSLVYNVYSHILLCYNFEIFVEKKHIIVELLYEGSFLLTHSVRRKYKAFGRFMRSRSIHVWVRAKKGSLDQLYVILGSKKDPIEPPNLVLQSIGGWGGGPCCSQGSAYPV